MLADCQTIDINHCGHVEQAQRSTIIASKAVAGLVRTVLGPKSMLKMLLDAHGGIVLTNDGNAVLREFDVRHPAAKCMISLSCSQDENVGDGTTTVVVIAGEVLQIAESFLNKKVHPAVINAAYSTALKEITRIVERISMPVNIKDRGLMNSIVDSSIGTKFSHRFGTVITSLAIEAVACATIDLINDRKEVELQKCVKIEKIPGGTIEESCILKGTMFNKDVINPGRMRRRILNPRIILLDCALEYKKGENVTNVEMTDHSDFANLLEIEEISIRRICDTLLSFHPDVVISEKGISDLAAHFLQKAGVAAIRRVRKSDNVRISRACGATIVHRAGEIKETDVGTYAGLFEVQKIGNDFFSFIVDCTNPKACTIILRGASKDMLNEIERNVIDALSVTRNVILKPSILPGGGAVEMEISRQLRDKSQQIEGLEKWPYRGIGMALEVIPRTLSQNSGANVLRCMTKLRVKHTEDEGTFWGLNGYNGNITDMRCLRIWEPLNVKLQAITTAIEAANLLLRVDDIISGSKEAMSSEN